MRISYRWLRELLPELAASPDEVADRLSFAGLAVDAIEHLGDALRALEVVRVTGLEPHPKRSGLRLVAVERRSGTQRVVCGARNVPDPGGYVVLAPLGSRLPGLDFTLEPREIGGVLSEGMLVSEAELGLAEQAEGILIVKSTTEPGTPFLQVFPEADDVIFELDVTPNRPDALGHVGVARELAALFALPFQEPSRDAEPAATDELEKLIRIENQAPDRCPHYAAAAVLNVSVGPSPKWMQWRLHRLGIRPISNVVDVTNWLLLEFGQPLHAFDLDRIGGKLIRIRQAAAAERFTTLDGIQRTLETDDLVICDAEGPAALAGVMGGADSEIQESTRQVLLECAYFMPGGVRRSARRHGLHTESSHRFERGVNFGAIEVVLARAKAMLVELAGASAVPGMLHARGKPLELPRISLRARHMQRLLGSEIPFDEALSHLNRLGLQVESVEDGAEGKRATVRGASFRPDIRIEADLIEEVARVHGLEKIPTRLPRIAPQAVRSSGKLEREIADIAVALGLSEALTYAFVAKRDLEAVSALPPVVALENPLTEERSVMRTSLLPGLLEALRRAERRGERAARLFSVGARFLPPAPPASARAAEARPRHPDDQLLPEERPSFAALLAGPRTEPLTLKPAEVDVFDAKGLAVELIERLTRAVASVRALTGEKAPAHLHPRGAAELLVEGVPVGVFGPLHPDVVDAFDLAGPAQIIELDLAQLEAVGKRMPRYQPIPKLPAIVRDLSLVVDEQVPAGTVQELISKAAGELCESVELAALFQGGSVPAGQRSLTYRVVYRDPKSRTDVEHARTLTDKEVDQLQAQVLRVAQQELGATLRG